MRRILLSTALLCTLVLPAPAAHVIGTFQGVACGDMESVVAQYWAAKLHPELSTTQSIYAIERKTPCIALTEMPSNSEDTRIRSRGDREELTIRQYRHRTPYGAVRMFFIVRRPFGIDI